MTNEDQIAELQDALRELAEENEQLRSQCSGACSDEQAQIAVLKAELAAVKTSRNSLQAEVAELKKLVSVYQSIRKGQRC